MFAQANKTFSPTWTNTHGRLAFWPVGRLLPVVKPCRPCRNAALLSFVRLALRRPYTAAIAALLIALLGVLSVTRMIVDIFPVIDIPVVLVVWSYPGLSATDMERRVNLISERAYSTTVNGISRIEFQVDSRRRHPQDLFPAGH